MCYLYECEIIKTQHIGDSLMTLITLPILWLLQAWYSNRILFTPLDAEYSS